MATDGVLPARRPHGLGHGRDRQVLFRLLVRWPDRAHRLPGHARHCTILALPRLGRVLINAQIAAPLWLPKKICSPLSSIRRIIASSVKVEATPARTHGEAAV